jgi:hypothetical protein
MIPDYIIYDELRRRRQQEERDQQPAVLELPLYSPEIVRYYDEQREREEREREEREREDEDPLGDRGVVIIDIDSWTERPDDGEDTG